MTVQWVALDWGTTNLRAFVVGEKGQILERLQSNKGMSQLSPEEFEPTLIDLISPFLLQDRVTPVIACGMVGAKQGWVEAPYAQVPCEPIARDSLISVPTKDHRIQVRIVPGICQRDPDDIMRGEETQIAGYLAECPSFDGVICLPGTHSKWVQVREGKVCDFTTFMTGEVFDLLSTHSVLRFCTDSHHWDDTAFLKAVAESVQYPNGLMAALFRLRPQSLLGGASNDTLKASLSGLLIGSELEEMQEMWRNLDVVIIGGQENSRLYQTALASLGACPKVYDSTTAVVRGLTAVSGVQTPVALSV